MVSIISKAFACGLVAVVASSSEAAQWKAVMSFEEAREPYAHAKYDRIGWVDSGGSIRGGGLGCSAYVSGVLHRMKYGHDFSSHFDVQFHQLYGDQAAKRFGLDHDWDGSILELCESSKTKELLASESISPGIFMFNVRNGKSGHVGFIEVDVDGGVRQWQYSQISNGLATGSFAEWALSSRYRRSQVQLFSVPNR